MAAEAATTTRVSPLRVAVASFIGTTVEFYDFLIYGTAAALVFPKLFFPNASPASGVLLSFATFGVGFFARPLGGIVFGHFGDRLGRKRMLVYSLVGMGVSTVLIGLLPTCAQIGVAAPILLTLLRLAQGFAVGGEWGGATLMAVEHAAPERKGFYGAFPQMGAPAGTATATLAFFLVSQLPDDQFLSWGWRIPFLFSAVLIVIGLVIRLTLSEGPDFAELSATSGVVACRSRMRFASIGGRSCWWPEAISRKASSRTSAWHTLFPTGHRSPKSAAPGRFSAYSSPLWSRW